MPHFCFFFASVTDICNEPYKFITCSLFLFTRPLRENPRPNASTVPVSFASCFRSFSLFFSEAMTYAYFTQNSTVLQKSALHLLLIFALSAQQLISGATAQQESTMMALRRCVRCTGSAFARLHRHAMVTRRSHHGATHHPGGWVTQGCATIRCNGATI